MRFTKKVIGSVNKCYAIGALPQKDGMHFLVAAEKPGPCIEFDAEGNQLSTVWEQPGGTMTVAQVPGETDKILATQRFYSPDDSKEASLVLATKADDGTWAVKQVASLPHVHRFGFVPAGESHWLIACTVCSGRDFTDDWSHPGKVYAWRIDRPLGSFSEENPIPFEMVKDGLVKNHGYWQGQLGGRDVAVVAAEEGVFSFCPPQGPGGAWDIRQLLNEPTSDMAFADLDGDGKVEMLTFSPFHGETLKVFKPEGDGWKQVYRMDGFAFAHAIWACDLNGTPCILAGHRGGSKRLVMVHFENGEYKAKPIDEDAGPANVFCFVQNGKTRIVAANRETDEIALYTVEV